MTREEVFKIITSKPKWYAGVILPQSASRILRKHNAGLYNNYEWLFGKFGYTIMQKELWTHEN